MIKPPKPEFSFHDQLNAALLFMGIDETNFEELQSSVGQSSQNLSKNQKKKNNQLQRKKEKLK